jgi:hypothetical protein
MILFNYTIILCFNDGIVFWHDYITFFFFFCFHISLFHFHLPITITMPISIQNPLRFSLLYLYVILMNFVSIYGMNGILCA